MSVISTGPQTVRLIGASGAQINSTNTTAEELLLAVPIPANAIGPNGMLRIDCLNGCTNSVNNKTPRIRFGLAADLSGTVISAPAVTLSAYFNTLIRLQNANSASSQKGSSAIAAGSIFGAGGAVSWPTAAIDTTQQTFIVFSSQKATGTESLTLERYTIEVLYRQ